MKGHREFLALSFIYFFDFARSQTADCSNTWLTMPSMNVLGGTQVPAAAGNTTACQQSCLAQTSCTGIDFDGAGQCWLTTTAPGYDPTDLVTHYELKRGVNSCNGACPSSASGQASWNATLNAHCIGGTSTPDPSLTSCLITCTSNVSCMGFDWNPDNSSGSPNCWIILNSNPVQTQAGVTHYQKFCGSNGFQIVTPGFINPANNGGSSAMSGASTVSATPGFGVPSGSQGWNGYTQAAGSLTGLAIQPAYIVLIGMGAGCILLVIIAVFILCTYPMAGRRLGKRTTGLFRAKPTTELHTRRPKTLTEEELNMTATTRDSMAYLESSGAVGENGGTMGRDGTMGRNGTTGRNGTVGYNGTVDRNSHADRYSAVQYNGGTVERNGVKEEKSGLGYNHGYNTATTAEYNDMAEEAVEQDTNVDDYVNEDAPAAEDAYFEEKGNHDENYD